MTTIRSFKPRERCRINSYLVEVERHARRTSYVRVLDKRLIEDTVPGAIVVQVPKTQKAASV